MRLSVLLFCFIAISSSAQNGPPGNKPKKEMHKSDYNKCGHNMNITTGVSFGKYTAFELSVGRSYSAYYNSPILETFSQYAFGMELLLDTSGNVFAPKVSTELVILKAICISRLNLLYYIGPEGDASLKYRHEIGVSYRGFVSVNYAHTFNFTNKKFVPPGNSLNIQINVPLGKRKWDSVN